MQANLDEPSLCSPGHSSVDSWSLRWSWLVDISSTGQKYLRKCAHLVAGASAPPCLSRRVAPVPMGGFFPPHIVVCISTSKVPLSIPSLKCHLSSSHDVTPGNPSIPSPSIIIHQTPTTTIISPINQRPIPSLPPTMDAFRQAIMPNPSNPVILDPMDAVNVVRAPPSPTPTTPSNPPSPSRPSPPPPSSTPPLSATQCSGTRTPRAPASSRPHGACARPAPWRARASASSP